MVWQGSGLTAPAGLHGTGTEEIETVGAIWVRALDAHPDRLAFRQGDLTLSHRQLADRISQSVQALQSLGLERGDTVAFLGGNSPEPLILQVTCALMRLRYTPFHPTETVESDGYRIALAEVKTVIVDAGRFADRAQAARKAGVAHVLPLGSPGWDELRDRFPPGPLASRCELADEVTIIFTGGTTGKPKGVVQTGRSLGALFAALAEEWEFPPAPQMLLMTPLSHAAGHFVLPTLLNGGTVHLMDGFDVAAFVDMVESGQVNCAFLVPTMIAKLLDQPGIEKRDFSALELIVYGAAPITRRLLERALALFGPILQQSYGQSEAHVLANLPRADHHGSRLASCGRIVPGMEVAIFDADGRHQPPCEVGEICVRGPIISDGYLRNPEETDRTFGDGWLHTADGGYLDQDGYLYIVDRLKDMIISGGFNVYPKEVEDVIAALPGVAEVAVVGLPDDRWGEAVTAAVRLHNCSGPSEEEIRAAVRRVCGPVQVPKQILFRCEPLPVTAFGKPDKKALRAELMGD